MQTTVQNSVDEMKQEEPDIQVTKALQNEGITMPRRKVIKKVLKQDESDIEETMPLPKDFLNEEPDIEETMPRRKVIKKVLKQDESDIEDTMPLQKVFLNEETDIEETMPRRKVFKNVFQNDALNENTNNGK